ncbi:MAG: response regulator [Prochlorotrichaceae cyanobacterium]
MSKPEFKPKVLIVDDIPTNLQMLMEILKEDYAVVTATSGEKALQLAAKFPQPDLILLDVMMPGMDGYEVCTQLKSNPQTQAIPIVFITALSEAGNEAQGFELGCIDYITKPFSPTVIKARLKSHLAIQQLNRELWQKNEQLARVTRLKDEFLANMSHELRTPLNAILGMTEALQDSTFGPVQDQQTKALRTVERSAFHLLALINEILDLAKIESGNVELDRSDVNVGQICLSSMTFVEQQAYKKRIQLQQQIPSLLPALYVDEIRVRQVLINLLTNAVKFTPEGGTVTLQVTCLPPTNPTSDRSVLRIEIIDTGIGIDPENLPKLFQPFVQIDSALNRQQTGTGLGLALVKQIVELHGGEVGVTSSLGQGSCFTIDFPYQVVTPEAHAETTAPEETIAVAAAVPSERTSPIAHTPLILLAEDNAANIATLSSYLEAKGYQLVYAQDGQAAIDQALAHQPDVILMDIQMPGIDGLQAMQQIREQDSLRNTPMIALTALAMEGDEERCLQAGANRYLSKPVRLKQLETLIRELQTNRSRERLCCMIGTEPDLS